MKRQKINCKKSENSKNANTNKQKDNTDKKEQNQK
jgi:hypothetical protein